MSSTAEFAVSDIRISVLGFVSDFVFGISDFVFEISDLLRLFSRSPTPPLVAALYNKKELKP
jgi:hypothetical protein